MFELSMIIGAILEIGANKSWDSLKRREGVIKILQRLNLTSEIPPNDFDHIYAYTLIEYGIFKSEPILDFFRNEFVREAFKQSFHENDFSILENEAEGIIQWNQETKKLGQLVWEPRREFAEFSLIFHKLVRQARLPTEVMRDHQLNGMQDQLSAIAEQLQKLDSLDTIREFINKLLKSEDIVILEHSDSIQRPQPIPISTPIRWLHLSDFHVGKNKYARQKLFENILDFIQERISHDEAPDLVFITGDIADSGQPDEYTVFAEEFFFPLIELLGKDSSHRVFQVPGNHDVDRMVARSVQRYNVLWSVEGFLDPMDEEGFDERKLLFPRFKAYVDADLTGVGGKWIESSQGAFIAKPEIHGLKIGILGLNTAWLSGSDKDRHQLSAGKEILANGLEQIADCDVRIVLGHHPIDWFLNEDIQPVTSLLTRYNAVYLHGHFHNDQVAHKDNVSEASLTLQAGAAFKDRKKEIWKNCILWCQLYSDEQQIWVTPFRWTENDEWDIDDDSFSEHYRNESHWVFPLPQPKELEKQDTKGLGKKFAQKYDIPDGWQIITAEFLDRHRKSLSQDQIVSYFDGRIPRWQEALSPYIPQREVVNDLQKHLKNAYQMVNTPSVILFTGAGGEGKSTALRQVVGDLIDNRTRWKVLWHENEDTRLDGGFIGYLSRSADKWLVVSDEADLIAEDVFSIVKSIRDAECRNISFLLCCRDTDWLALKANRWDWQQYSNFVEEHLRGLSPVDADRIINAWEQQGTAGLGRLYGVSRTEAIKQLVNMASEEAAHEDGSFLGAMLQARIGEDMKSHVGRLLSRLEQRRVLNRTLLDVYAYIVAMHAENQQILSKDVLSHTLGCKTSEIKRLVIGPLGDEAAITTAGNYIFSRHRAIAETAVEIMSEDFHFDFDEIYIELAQAAVVAEDNGAFVPDYIEWKYLSTHFFEHGNQLLGIKLAKAVVDVIPHDCRTIDKLAQLYRKSGQTEIAVKMYRTLPENLTKNRAFYCEWGNCEGFLGNYSIGTWLSGVSLADVTERTLERMNLGMALTGLTTQLDKLVERETHLETKSIYLEACEAALHIGMLLQPDIEMSRLKNRLEGKFEDVITENANLVERFHRLQKGVKTAWSFREDELPSWVPEGDELTFEGLARRLQVSLVGD